MHSYSLPKYILITSTKIDSNFMFIIKKSLSVEEDFHLVAKSSILGIIFPNQMDFQPIWEHADWYTIMSHNEQCLEGDSIM